MVVMRVSQKKVLELQALLLQISLDRFQGPTGIEEPCGTTVLIPNQKAVHRHAAVVRFDLAQMMPTSDVMIRGFPALEQSFHLGPIKGEKFGDPGEVDAVPRLSVFFKLGEMFRSDPPCRRDPVGGNAKPQTGFTDDIDAGVNKKC